MEKPRHLQNVTQYLLKKTTYKNKSFGHIICNLQSERKVTDMLKYLGDNLNK
jgi:hypothetical protein